MSLRFILGRAGSGKTYHCLSEMARLLKEKQTNPVIFILPEQATFIHERMLVCDFMPHGYTGGEVTSFNRLAWQAARQSGKALKPILSEAARTLLMGRLLQQRRQDLLLFNAASAGHGLAAALASLAEEMLAYDIDPANLARAATNANGRFQAKIHDIALLYHDYALVLNDYDNLPTGLAFLTQAIEEQGFLSKALVFVDGYSSYTTKEISVLTALMRHSTQLEIALALDPHSLEQAALGQDIFHNCRQSYLRLLEIAQRLMIKVEDPLILKGEKGRFAQNQELALVEKHCYPWANGYSQQDIPLSLQVIATANPREEVVAAGREILRLVRQNGLRFRDISVIARDLRPYENLLPEIFGELNIPYFADSKKPLLYHPLLELIRSVLEIWAGEAHYRLVFRYFKSDLTPLTPAETDKLENYCLAHGVHHWHWHLEADWQYWRGREEPAEAEKLLAEINALRKKGGAALIRFLNTAPSADGQVIPSALINSLITLLIDLEVESSLKTWQKTALNAGRAEEAELHRQAYSRLNDFLAEAEQLLNGSLLEARQLWQLLDAGCASLTLSLIPPGLDQVLVASLERSRNPELRAALVLGLNADILPGRAAPSALLADHERAELARTGIELAPDTISRQMAEHYLAYIALTRSHEQLSLIYALNNMEGKALQPSPLIKSMQILFPALKIKRFTEPQTAEELTNGTDTLNALTRHLREERRGTPLPVFWREIQNWYSAQKRWHQKLLRITQGLYFAPYEGRLSEQTRTAMYGKTIKSSVSRLEKFNSCPFAYFAAYGLNLQPRTVYEITALERGDIYHKALAKLSSLLAKGKPSWQELEQTHAAQLVEQVLDELIPGILSNILHSTARYRYRASRLKDTLCATLMIVAEHIKQSHFVPVAWELPFGGNFVKALPPFIVELENGRKLEINGQIDRVDIAQTSGGAYVRIIDYKSSKQTLSLKDILNGLRLQLPVYLETVLTNQRFFQVDDLRPAGFYYMAVQDELAPMAMPPANKESSPVGLRLLGLTIKDMVAVRLADPQISGHSKLIPVALSANGFYANSPGLTTEEFQELRNQLTSILRQTAENMIQGLASVMPRRESNFDACTYCNYRIFCGIDGELVRR